MNTTTTSFSLTRLTFGKYEGYDVSIVPKDYLDWGLDNLESPKWKSIFRKELKSRHQKYLNLKARCTLHGLNAVRIELENWFECFVDDDDNFHRLEDLSIKRIEDLLKDFCLVVETEKKLEQLKKDYQVYFPRVTAEKIIENWGKNYGNLYEDNFSSKENYEVALRFMQDYDAITSWEYLMASDRLDKFF